MARRVAISIVLIVVIPAITFFMEGLIPGNAATAILPLNATALVRHNLIKQLGLNRPVWVQYFRWFGNCWSDQWKRDCGHFLEPPRDSGGWVGQCLRC